MTTHTLTKTRSVATRSSTLPAAPAAKAADTTKERAGGTKGEAAPQAADRETAIRERAYSLYEREGRVDGHALDHWLEAEAQLAEGPASDC
jgi:hypothetical protein